MRPMRSPPATSISSVQVRFFSDLAMTVFLCLKGRCRERIAIVRIAAVETALEPAAPLFGRSVRKGFRYDTALHLLLNVVVADLRGRIERLVNVARLKHA